MEDLLLDDNQIIEEDTDGIAFEEFDEVEETTETEEVQEEAEQVEDEKPEDEQQELKLDDIGDIEVKFLHEIKKLKDFDKDELKTFVQKGMNHDRISEKLKANESILENFTEIADFYGYDLSTLTEALYEQYYHYKADKDGKTPNEVKLEHQLQKTNKVSSNADKQTKAFDRLLDSYPDVKADSIKQETWEKFNDGVDLRTAYELQLKDDKLSEVTSQLSQLQNELKTLKQNSETKKKSVVKSTTSNGTGDTGDDFLDGFYGGF